MLGAALLAGAACRDASGPPDAGPPYLAIVAKIVPGSEGGVGTQYAYRIREISGTLDIDRTIRVTPYDTVIVSLPPASYVIELGDGVPSTCRVRDDGKAFIVLDSLTNTGIVRFFVTCQQGLTIETGTDGRDVDDEFLYRLTSSAGEQYGIIRSNDTVGVDPLPAGQYTLSLLHVAPNCVVTSNGGVSQRITVSAGGGTTAAFRIVCSREAERPRILSFAASAHSGAAAFHLRVADPNADVDQYYFDLTDCRGTSVLPGGVRLRKNLTGSRIRKQDTATIVAGYEIGLSDSAVAGRCAAIRVTDYYGNSTPVVETSLTTRGNRPGVTHFNARLIGTSWLRTEVGVSDVDGDFAGVFALARLRDGILSVADGHPDVGIFNTVGNLSLPLPDVPLGNGRPKWDDYYAVIIHLIDEAGNFTRLEDADLFR
jgi:hypothetical protein